MTHVVPAPTEILSSKVSAEDRAALHALLRDAIESGASVGFMLPVLETHLEAFWSQQFADVTGGKRIIIVTRDELGRIVGSVQLELAGRANSLHRCELQKLLVHRTARGRGLGTALVRAAETAARSRGRTLIVLDTSATGNALGVYGRCGYSRVGVIPRYALDPDGPMIDTVFYYKELERT
jgi:ribosomal protein S18 acetylase RimI-like enzyme